MRRSVATLLVLVASVTLFGAKASKKDPAANEKLLFAVQAMDVTRAQAAVKVGANINGTDEDGWPFFITAVTSNAMELIDFFLSRKVKLDLKGPDGKTALMHAIVAGNEDLSLKLLQRGAGRKTTDDKGKTPLMYAAEKGLVKVVKWLVDKKTDPYQTDVEGRNALSYAVENRQREVIRILKVFEISPDELATAVIKGDTVTARKLILKGANVNAPNYEDAPPS